MDRGVIRESIILYDYVHDNYVGGNDPRLCLL